MKFGNLVLSLGFFIGVNVAGTEAFAQNCATQCSASCDFQIQQLMGQIGQYHSRCGTTPFPPLPYNPKLACLIGSDGYYWVTNIDTGAKIDKRGAYLKDCQISLKTFKDGLGCALGKDGYYATHSAVLGRDLSERNSYLKDCQASLATLSKGMVCALATNGYYVIVNATTGIKLTTRPVYLKDCIAQIQALP